MHLMRRTHEIYKKYIYTPSGVNVKTYALDFKELFFTSKTFAGTDNRADDLSKTGVDPLVHLPCAIPCNAVCLELKRH